MRVLQVHNTYRVRGGEDVLFDAITSLLRDRGVEVSELVCSSEQIRPGIRGRISAFASGLYSRPARTRLTHLVERERPDLVHVHNLYPLLSPSVLAECRRRGLPVVMTCHNLRLICPDGMALSHGEVCERCYGREYWCVLRNCRGSLAESAAYALRCYVARKLRLFKDNVTLFITPTDFIRRKLAENGFGESRLAVVPHMVTLPDVGFPRPAGSYVAYAGRVSPEKGVQVLVAAAARCPDLTVRIAGDFSAMPDLPRSAPGNVRFVGVLTGEEMRRFYAGARLVVVPSICLESFGLAAAEAMSYGLPVVASRIGGQPEVVDDAQTGLLFEPGDEADLAAKLNALWNDPARCRQMGLAGRNKVSRQYSPAVFFGRLMAAYARAIAINAAGRDARDRECA